MVTIINNGQNTERLVFDLKKKLQNEGLPREWKIRRFFENNVEKKKRKDSERVRRKQKRSAMQRRAAQNAAIIPSARAIAEKAKNPSSYK